MSPLVKCSGSGSYIEWSDRLNENGRRPWTDDEPRVKGRCPTCYKRLTLNTDGTLRAHGKRERKSRYNAPTPITGSGSDAKTLTRRYQSWGEFLEAVQGPSDMATSQRTSRDSGDNRWTMARNWSEAMDLAKNGWHDTTPDAESFCVRVSDEIITNRMATTFDPQYAVAGAVVDMGRYMTGDPECMVNAEPFTISKAGRAIRLAVPVCVPSMTSTATITRRGVAIMALATLLARANHPLEVWAGSGLHDHARSMRMVYMVKVQAADEQLDTGRLMFALAHPSMLRRLMFSIEEQEDSTTRGKFRVGHSYGYPSYALKESDFPPEDDSPGTSIILPDSMQDENWRDDEWIVEWLNKTITSIIGEE